VSLADAATAAEGRFDPRNVLRHVIRDPLREAADSLPAGRFPSPSFAAAVDSTRRSVTSDVRARLEGAKDGDRRTALLGFWTPAPVDELVNAHPAIHEAFRLPEFDGAKVADSPVGPSIAKTPKAKPAAFPEVEAWANEDKVLPSGIAREIRQVVFDAVLEDVRQGPRGLRVRGKERKYEVGAIRFEVDSVRIEAAAGGGAEVERPFEIQLSRSSKMAVVVKALLSTERTGRWAAADDEQYSDFVSLVDGWAGDLVRAATKRDVDLEPSTRILALTSQPAIASASTAGERLECALLHQLEPEPRGPAWSVWYKSAEQSRRTAIGVFERSLSGAKGTGASSILDGAAIMQHLDKAARLRRLGDKLSGSETMVALQRDLRDLQDVTTRTSWSEVDRLLADLRPHLAPGAAWGRIRDEVDGAILRAHKDGLLAGPGARDELAVLAEAVPENAILIMAELERKQDSSARELWDLVPDPVPTLEALLAYCRLTDGLLDEVERRLDGDADRGSEGIGLGTGVVAFRELAGVLERAVERKV